MGQNRVGLFLLSFTFCFFMGNYEASAEIGVTDKEIIIGTHQNESGLGTEKLGTIFSHFFDDINEKGGIHGRKIKLIRADVGNVVSRAVDSTKKMVEEENIFALVAGNPPTPHRAVWKYLVEKNVPDMFFVDGAKVYNEKLYKTVFPFLPQFSNDGASLASHVVKILPGKKACFLVINADTGLEWADGAKEAIEKYNKGLKPADSSKKIEIVRTEKVDRMANSLNVETLALKRAGCEIVFANVLPVNFPKAVNFAFEQGFKPQWVTAAVSSKANIFKLVNEPARDGILTAMWFQRDKMGENDPLWKDVEKFGLKHNLGDSVGFAPQMLVIGEILVEALKRAGRDLTREKLISAAESMTGWKCTLCFEPLQVSPKQHWSFTNTKVFMWKNKNNTFVPVN